MSKESQDNEYDHNHTDSEAFAMMACLDDLKIVFEKALKNCSKKAQLLDVPPCMYGCAMTEFAIRTLLSIAYVAYNDENKIELLTTLVLQVREGIEETWDKRTIHNTNRNNND